MKKHKEKRQVGRPRLPVALAKSEALRFRLTPVEKRHLVEMAEKQGTSYALLARSFVMEKLDEALQAA